MRYIWIGNHRRDYSAAVMCEVLRVSRSGYYTWILHKPGPRALRREQIRRAVASAHARSYRIYGHRKVREDLMASDDSKLHCCKTTVWRAMSVQGLGGRRRRRFVRTTKVDPRAQPAPDLLKRNFTADRRNEKWVADMTYIQTEEGWLYLTAVLDLHSRKVVGWATSKTIDADLAYQAMRNALMVRRPSKGLIHHSDRGSQYTSGDYQKLLKAYEVESSMSRKGDPWDNAPIESFMGSLKGEWMNRRRCRTHAQAHSDLFQYIELFYNRQRRHAALGYKSPTAFEEDRAA